MGLLRNDVKFGFHRIRVFFSRVFKIMYWSSPSFSFDSVDGEPDISSVVTLSDVTDDCHIISLKQ